MENYDGTKPFDASFLYALDLVMPQAITTSDYNQIIKNLEERAALYDRGHDLLVFAAPEHRAAAEPILTRHAITAEPLELLLLPPGFVPRPTFTDFGFASLMQRYYLYADTSALFILHPSSSPTARAFEPDQAAGQLEEHLLGDWKDPDGTFVFAIESQHDGLAEGIARAYGCEVEWLYPGL